MIFSKIFIWTLTLVHNSYKSVSLITQIITSRLCLKECITQIHKIGVNSTVITVTSGIFIGLVLCLQGYYTLSQFGAQSLLGVMVALSVLRELGPVVTAMLFAGRA